MTDIYSVYIDSCLSSIRHHLDRAAMHVKNRNHDYAIGSRKKALKWIKRLQEIVNAATTDDELVTSIMADSVADDFENMLLYGDPDRQDERMGIPSLLSEDTRVDTEGFGWGSLSATRVKKS